MIEKLNPNEWNMEKTINKINEIIDHLPQEKELKCESCGIVDAELLFVSYSHYSCIWCENCYQRNKKLNNLHSFPKIRVIKNKSESTKEPQEKEPDQPPKSNHLEVNYIAVGYYKHEIDFGVLGSVQELSDTDFEKMLDMLQTAIRVAKEMRARKQPTKEVPDIRGVLRLLVARSRKKEYTTFIDQEDEQRIDVAFQEISALYRKENV